jgi:prevent-host-death family protein
MSARREIPQALASSCARKPVEVILRRERSKLANFRQMAVRICLGQLKHYACGYLEQVSAGETLEIVRRGRLVAFVVPPFLEPSSDVECIGAADPPGPNAKIPLSQLRRNAAPYFDRVAAGNVIDVVRHGRLIARIVAANYLP